ncbi:MAG: hypothetical protein QM762_11275 [Chryseolinea sp.]
MNATLAKYTYPEGLYQLHEPVLVLLPCSWEKVSESEQQLLAKILSSVKLSLAAVQIISASKYSVEDATVLRARTILSFGVPFDGLTQPYEATTIEDVTVVYADPVGSLDDVRKKNLWGALRQAFKL